MNTSLISTDLWTTQIRELGIHDWQMLTKFIQNLPYGRNQNRIDFSLVLSERKGSCSSKHAFLKE
ncbi:MAG: hypothetical protein JKY22_10775, partial [Flavobacteriaceae bacterium]|nr:hypothetical protein [Flavobacteriaceae bacterium]